MSLAEVVWWGALAGVTLPFWDAPLLTVAHRKNRFVVRDDGPRNRSLAAFLVLALVYALALRGRWPLVGASPAVRLAGALLAAAGSGFAAWGKIALGRLFSSALGIKESHTLVTHGPYRVVRHPIYAGVVVFLAGSAVVWNDTALLAIAALVLLLLSRHVRIEERMFAGHFGADYEEYRRRTPALVPRVRR